MLVIEFPLVRPSGISLLKILAQRPAVKSCFTHVFMQATKDKLFSEYVIHYLFIYLFIYLYVYIFFI
jgi:hypothetical protein